MHWGSIDLIVFQILSDASRHQSMQKGVSLSSEVKGLEKGMSDVCIGSYFYGPVLVKKCLFLCCHGDQDVSLEGSQRGDGGESERPT